mmetsp:Transcript_105049/g.334470  ORF Transcript_105049/g.334470 Transcript_105049/m.334470 type:complete len:236 (-) Transcript_105049:358-1065(-)
MASHLDELIHANFGPRDDLLPRRVLVQHGDDAITADAGNSQLEMLVETQETALAWVLLGEDCGPGLQGMASTRLDADANTRLHRNAPQVPKPQFADFHFTNGCSEMPAKELLRHDSAGAKPSSELVHEECCHSCQHKLKGNDRIPWRGLDGILEGLLCAVLLEERGARCSSVVDPALRWSTLLAALLRQEASETHLAIGNLDSQLVPAAELLLERDVLTDKLLPRCHFLADSRAK